MADVIQSPIKYNLKQIFKMAVDSKDKLKELAKSVNNQDVKIYLHWTAGDYDTCYSDYHVNITKDGTTYVTNTDLSLKINATYQRNSGSVSISLCCAKDASTEKIGDFPPTEDQINSMIQVIAALSSGLEVPIDKKHVLTHGEAGDNEDEWNASEPYGPKSEKKERWDLEYLGTKESSKYNPEATDGTRGGDVLRKKAVEFQEKNVNDYNKGETYIANNLAPGGSSTSSGRTSNTSGIEEQGNRIIIKPFGKTFCEPMYPDLVTVPGNIPTSLIEQTAGDEAKGKSVGTSANPYKVMSGSAIANATGLDLGGFTTDHAQQKRQAMFNVEDNINDRKVVGGKIINNNDRYPVDLKIEELLIHQPCIKQNAIKKSSNMTKELAAAILTGLDHAEKRMVKVENVLSVVMRNLFALAGRIHVNCVYYGGQSQFGKYKNIRCMRDNRVQDGQIVQLDQCLSCTRYEPIYGATYDIMNSVGANVANVLDDTQMAYMNLRDYAEFSRIAMMPSKKEDAEFDTSQNTIPPIRIDFKDEWDKGVKMRWPLTPKENQKAMINWRQDIRKPDKSPKKLPSFQFNAANAGSQSGGSSVAADACPIITGKYKDEMERHYKYLTEDGKKIDEIKGYIEEAEKWASGDDGRCRAAITSCNTQKYADTLNKLAKDNDTDGLLMFSIFAVESGAILNADNGGIAQLSALKDKKNLTAEEEIGTSIKAIKEYLDKYGPKKNPMIAVTLFCEGAGDDSGKFIKKKSDESQLFDKDWVSNLKYDFSDTDKYSKWPKVVCAYHFFCSSTLKNGSLAAGDSDEDYDFLFRDSDLDNVNFVSDFGGKNTGSGNSVLEGSISFEVRNEIEIYASKDGTVTDTGSDEHGNFVKISYGSDVIEYHGISDNAIAKGKEVKKKDSIGKSAKALSIIYYRNGKITDPKQIWPSLSGKVSKDENNGSLGAILKQGADNTQTVTAKNSIAVGGNTDGTYDMDDESNYDMSDYTTKSADTWGVLGGGESDSGGGGVDGVATKPNIPANLSLGEKIVTSARYYCNKGIAYHLEAPENQNPWSTMDCGLFTKVALEQAGITAPARTADAQYLWLSKQGAVFSDLSQVTPGDMVFYHNTYSCKTDENCGVTHVGIMVDNSGTCIQCDCSTGVHETNMSSGYWQNFSPVFGRIKG